MAIRHKEVTYFILSVGILPLAFLSIFRGSVGPDTVTYFAFLEQLRLNVDNVDLYEPLFTLLSKELMYIFNNSSIVMGIYPVIFTFVIFLAGKRIDKYGVILATIIVPVFYIDMTMNAIRIGLSFSVVLYSMLYLAKGEIKKYFIVGIIASLFHISGFLIVLMTYSLFTKKWKIIIITIIACFAVVFFFDEYLLSKLAGYESMSSPSKFSGLSTLVMSGMLLFVWFKYANLRENSLSILCYSFIYTIASYLLIFVSYAGLRIQTLVFISVLCAFLVHIYRENIELKLSAKFYFVAIGVAGFMFKLKNFYEGYGIVASPFLPYNFIWN